MLYYVVLHFIVKRKVLLRGVGTLRYLLILSEQLRLSSAHSVQWQPCGLTIHDKKWFLGARAGGQGVRARVTARARARAKSHVGTETHDDSTDTEQEHLVILSNNDDDMCGSICCETG